MLIEFRYRTLIELPPILVCIHVKPVVNVVIVTVLLIGTRKREIGIAITVSFIEYYIDILNFFSNI